jgi:hypothetical protein
MRNPGTDRKRYKIRNRVTLIISFLACGTVQSGRCVILLWTDTMYLSWGVARWYQNTRCHSPVPNMRKEGVCKHREFHQKFLQSHGLPSAAAQHEWWAHGEVFSCHVVLGRAVRCCGVQVAQCQGQWVPLTHRNCPLTACLRTPDSPTTHLTVSPRYPSCNAPTKQQ